MVLFYAVIEAWVRGCLLRFRSLDLQNLENFVTLKRSIFNLSIETMHFEGRHWSVFNHIYKSHRSIGISLVEISCTCMEMYDTPGKLCEQYMWPVLLLPVTAVNAAWCGVSRYTQKFLSHDTTQTNFLFPGALSLMFELSMFLLLALRWNILHGISNHTNRHSW